MWSGDEADTSANAHPVELWEDSEAAVGVCAAAFRCVDRSEGLGVPERRLLFVGRPGLGHLKCA